MLCGDAALNDDRSSFTAITHTTYSCKRAFSEILLNFRLINTKRMSGHWSTQMRTRVAYQKDSLRASLDCLPFTPLLRLAHDGTAYIRLLTSVSLL